MPVGRVRTFGAAKTDGFRRFYHHFSGLYLAPFEQIANFTKQQLLLAQGWRLRLRVDDYEQDLRDDDEVDKDGEEFSHARRFWPRLSTQRFGMCAARLAHRRRISAPSRQP
jgi:hypothetical protein